MSREQIIPIEEWKAIGTKTKQMYNDYFVLTKQLNHRLPKTTKSMKTLVKLNATLGTLKSQLEDDMIKQHPNWGQETKEDCLKVFYGE